MRQAAWVLALVGVAQWPKATAAVPVLRLLAGRAGVFVLVLTVLVWWTSRVDPAALARIRSRFLFLGAAAVLSVIALHNQRSVQASGDEPEYLLMAESLWKEGDLDLRDNWERRDYLDYVPGLERMPFGTYRKDGRPISTHSSGLPALLAPIYALGGRAACVIALAVAAAAMAVAVRALALQVTGHAAAALLAWVAALGPPALYFSFLVYTEIPSALAIAVSLRLLTSDAPFGGAHSIRSGVLAALVVALLPWLHVKMIPAAVVLGVIALWRMPPRARAAFVAIAVLASAGYVAYYEIVFGVPSPLGLYGGKLPRMARHATPEKTVFALFLDRAYGLLPYAPIWLAALGGFVLLLRRGLRDSLPYLLLAAAIFIPILGWRVWFAGFCPPARFLVPLVPVLGVCLAVRAASRTYGVGRWAAALLLFGYLLVPIAVWQPEELFIVHAKHDPPRLFGWLVGEEMAVRYLPSFTVAGEDAPHLMVLWIILLALLAALDMLAARFRAVDRLFQGPLLPIAVVLVVGLVVDGPLP